MLKQPVKALLLALVAVLVVATPVLAYVYKAQYVCTNNSTTDYTMMPFIGDVNNDWMASNGFMLASANDTRIETLVGVARPHMVTENMTMTAIASPAHSQTNLYYVTGQSELESFDIIPGHDGYVTKPDSATTELGDNFTYQTTGWVDTTANSDNTDLMYKERAIRVFASPDVSENVTVWVYSTTSENSTYMTPDGHITCEWTSEAGAACNNHYQNVDNTAIDDATFNQCINQSATKEDVFTLSSAGLSDNGTAISTVKLYIRVQTATANASATWVQVALQLGGVSENGTQRATGGSFTSYQESMARPGGGSWLVGDLDDLIIEVHGYTSGAGSVEISHCFVIVDYINPIVTASATATGVSSGEHTVKVEAQGPAEVKEELSTGDNDAHTTDSYTTWLGQTFTVDKDFVVRTVRMYGAKAGSPGDLELKIRATTAGLPTGSDLTSATKLEADIVGAAPNYRWNSANLTTPITLMNGTQYALLIRTTASIGAKNVRWRADSTPPYTGGTMVRSTDNGTTWAINTGYDFLFQIENDAGLAIYIDGTLIDVSTTIATVPNNSENWTFMDGNSMPYADNITLHIGGTRQLYYAPTAMIVGTTLPDRDGADHNGTFHWGTNPSGLWVTLGSMVSSGQPSLGATIDQPTQDILQDVEVTDWFIEPDVSGSLLTNPIRPFVTLLSDNSTLTERQVWILYGLAFVLFATVATSTVARGHHGITGIMCAASMVGLVSLTIWPLWTVVFVAGAIIAGLVSERSPSL